MGYKHIRKERKVDSGDERWSLTPKSCLAIALTDTKISPTDVFLEDINEHTFRSAYIILEKRMNNAGYITDKEGKTKDEKGPDTPETIFTRTIKGFYPDASEEQIRAAWELFVYHMIRQGNAKKNLLTCNISVFSILIG